MEGGADDVKFDDEVIEIFAEPENFKSISEQLEQAGIQAEEAGLKMIPTQEITLEPDAAAQVLKVIEALEDLDDVQEVFSNLNITEEALAKMGAA